MVSTQMKSGLFMAFGACAVVLGAIAVVYWPPLFFAQLQKMMTLTPTSMSFGIWRETPIPMYLECFMFNVTNVADLLAGKNVSMKVEQLGPYVYKEEHRKENITFNKNGTVTFYNKRSWYFEPEMSNGSLSDQITSVNPVIVTMAYMARHWRPAFRLGADVFLRMFHDNIFLTANVSQWLFDGIDDPILSALNKVPNLPYDIPYDKFGWFYERNNSLTYDGVFVMNTGAGDFSLLGNVELWQHSNQTMYREECGQVRGSTGELWAPELGQPDVTIFAPDICTYMILSKNGTDSVEDIEGVRYAANNSVFDNGYRYPHMACYCDEIRDENCLHPGALNVSACRYGAPAFVSLPHFLHCDPHYPGKIDGLHPKDEHNFHLTLEMYTGMPLAVAAQLQINLLVRHIPAMTINNVFADPDVLVPMFWFRQEMRTTPAYARLARAALHARYYVPYALYGLTIIGLILLVTGITILIKKLLSSPETDPIMSETDEEQ